MGVVQQAVDDTAGAAQLIAQNQWRYAPLPAGWVREQQTQIRGPI